MNKRQTKKERSKADILGVGDYYFRNYTEFKRFYRHLEPRKRRIQRIGTYNKECWKNLKKSIRK